MLDASQYARVREKMERELPAGSEDTGWELDTDQFRAAMNRLYGRMGFSAPVILWAANPVHLQMMPFLLQSLLKESQYGPPSSFAERFKDKLMLRWNLPHRLKGDWLDAYNCLLRQLTPAVESVLRPHGHGRPATAAFPLEDSYGQVFCRSGLGFPVKEGVDWLLSAATHDAREQMQTKLGSLARIQLSDLFIDHLDSPVWHVRNVVLSELRHRYGSVAPPIFDFNGPVPSWSPVSRGKLVDDLLKSLPSRLCNYLSELHDLRCRHSRIDGTSALSYSDNHARFLTPSHRINNELGCELYSPVWAAWCRHETSMFSAAYELYGEELFSDDLAEQISDLHLVQQSAFSYVFASRVVFACRKPRLMYWDAQRRLHRMDGPSLLFDDGFPIYSWQGVQLTPEQFMQYQILSARKIQEERNTELRRVLINLYGEAKFLEDSGAEEIHQDQFGHLLCKRLEGDEDIVMLRVTNATAEPDGTFKNYYLRVPPQITTARAAAAWTFGLGEEDYSPSVET